jgi:hypothetical protein
VGNLPIWPWTRSVKDPGAYDGSPYSTSRVGDGTEQLKPGNANAVRDGIVLVLTAGGDHEDLQL